jgi:hypothetical protein
METIGEDPVLSVVFQMIKLGLDIELVIPNRNKSRLLKQFGKLIWFKPDFIPRAEGIDQFSKK